MYKRLVAGLSRLVTCLQSNFIGTNFRGLLFKLRRLRAFQLSLCFLLGAYWLAGSRLPDGGGESHHFRENRNPGPGHLPAPAATQKTKKMAAFVWLPTPHVHLDAESDIENSDTKVWSRQKFHECWAPSWVLPSTVHRHL